MYPRHRREGEFVADYMPITAHIAISA
jgi:hypothetical protein